MIVVVLREYCDFDEILHYLTNKLIVFRNSNKGNIPHRLRPLFKSIRQMRYINIKSDGIK